MRKPAGRTALAALTTVGVVAAASTALAISVLAIGLTPAGVVGHVIWSAVVAVSVAVSAYCSVRLSRDYGVPGRVETLPGTLDPRQEIRCFVPFWRRSAWAEFAALRAAAVGPVAQVVAVSKQFGEDLQGYRAEAREQKIRFRQRLGWLFNERPPDVAPEPPGITGSPSWARLAAEAASDVEVAEFLLRHRRARRHQQWELPSPDYPDDPPDGSGQGTTDASGAFLNDDLGSAYSSGDGGPFDPADSATWWQRDQADGGDSAALMSVDGDSPGAVVIASGPSEGLDLPIHDLGDVVIAGFPWVSSVAEWLRRIDVISSGRLDTNAAVEDTLESAFWMALATGAGVLADLATGGTSFGAFTIGFRTVMRRWVNWQRDQPVAASHRNLAEAMEAARKQGEAIGQLLRTQLAPSARLSIAVVDRVADEYPRAETGPRAHLVYAALGELGEASLLHVRKLQALRPRLPRAARAFINADSISRLASELAAVAGDWSAEIDDPAGMIRVLAAVNMKLLMSGMGCADLGWQPRYRDLQAAQSSSKDHYIEWARRLDATVKDELERLGNEAEEIAGPWKKAAEERINRAATEYAREVARRRWEKPSK